MRNLIEYTKQLFLKFRENVSGLTRKLRFRLTMRDQILVSSSKVTDVPFRVLMMVRLGKNGKSVIVIVSCRTIVTKPKHVYD